MARDVQFKILVSERERAMIAALAERKGLTPTDLTRTLVGEAFASEFGERAVAFEHEGRIYVILPDDDGDLHVQRGDGKLWVEIGQYQRAGGGCYSPHWSGPYGREMFTTLAKHLNISLVWRPAKRQPRR